MDLKKKFMQQGMKVMSDPRVMKMMQDPRFMKVMMGAMQVPAKVQAFGDQQRDALLKAMGGASRQEVRDLQRSMRALEHELHDIKSQQLAEEEGGELASRSHIFHPAHNTRSLAHGPAAPASGPANV